MNKWDSISMEWILILVRSKCHISLNYQLANGETWSCGTCTAMKYHGTVSIRIKFIKLFTLNETQCCIFISCVIFYVLVVVFSLSWFPSVDVPRILSFIRFTLLLFFISNSVSNFWRLAISESPLLVGKAPFHLCDVLTCFKIA